MNCKEKYKLFGIYSNGKLIRVIVEMNQCNITGFQFSVESFERSDNPNNQNPGLTNQNINRFLCFKYIGGNNIFTNSMLISPKCMDNYAYMGQTTEAVKEKLEIDFNTLMKS